MAAKAPTAQGVMATALEASTASEVSEAVAGSMVMVAASTVAGRAVAGLAVAVEVAVVLKVELDSAVAVMEGGLVVARVAKAHLAEAWAYREIQEYVVGVRVAVEMATGETAEVLLEAWAAVVMAVVVVVADHLEAVVAAVQVAAREDVVQAAAVLVAAA